MKRLRLRVVWLLLLLVLSFILCAVPAFAGGAAVNVSDYWAAFVAYAIAFVHDPRFLTIAGLIILDIGFGLAEAIKTGQYKWREVAKFMQTMVAPYLFAYLVLHVGMKLVAGSLMEGIPVEALSGLLWAFIVTTIWSSVMGHWVSLGLPASDRMKTAFK